MELQPLLKNMIDAKASDIFVVAGLPLAYEANGTIVRLDTRPLMPADTREVVASIYVHMFFVAITLIIFWAYGFAPDLYSLQIVYYSFATFILALGLSYITASVVVFFRDLSEIINILMQILVWATPIMWNVESTLSKGLLKTILKANPLYYIVNGYRNALINKHWFWETPTQMVYFWVVAVIIMVTGMLVFRRLRKHFADVL